MAKSASGVGRKVLNGVGRAAGKSIVWGGAKLGNALATPFDPARRAKFVERRVAGINKRRKWANLDGTIKPAKQPMIKALTRGSWACRCGAGSNDLRDRAQHKCDPAKLRKREEASAAAKAVDAQRRRVKQVSKTHGTGGTAARPSKPSKPNTSTTTTARPTPSGTAGGARIVRSNTAAERFAYLAQAEPETAHEIEQLFNDTIMGFLRLGQEMTDLAERFDIDPRVVEPWIRAADKATEPIEDLRDARRVFRILYAPWLDDNDVKMPKNPHKFFGQKTA